MKTKLTYLLLSFVVALLQLNAQTSRYLDTITYNEDDAGKYKTFSYSNMDVTVTEMYYYYDPGVSGYNTYFSPNDHQFIATNYNEVKETNGTYFDNFNYSNEFDFKDTIKVFFVGIDSIDGNVTIFKTYYLGKTKEQLTTINDNTIFREDLITSGNPVDERISLNSDLTGNSFTFKIYNTNGRLYSKGNILGSPTLIVSNLQIGVYLLQVQSGNKVYTTKFIKAK